MRAKVLIDVDGPLTGGFCSELCRHLRTLGVPEAFPHAVTEWDIIQAFSVQGEIGDEALARMRRPGVALGFVPRSGAFALIEEIRKIADPVAVTAPLEGSPTWAHEREIWLEEHLGFGLDEIVSVRDKSLIPGAVLIDDRLSNLLVWGSAHPSGRALLWDEAHNQNAPWRGPRVKDFFEILRNLDGL